MEYAIGVAVLFALYIATLLESESAVEEVEVEELQLQTVIVTGFDLVVLPHDLDNDQVIS